MTDGGRSSGAFRSGVVVAGEIAASRRSPQDRLDPRLHLHDCLLKAVADDVPAGQQVFFRSAFALVPIAIMLLMMKGQRLRRVFITSDFISHLWRGGVGALSMIAWFFAIARLDLPAAMAIGFLSPLLVIPLAGIVLGEKLTATRIIAVLLGFVDPVHPVAAAQAHRASAAGGAETRRRGRRPRFGLLRRLRHDPGAPADQA